MTKKSVSLILVLIILFSFNNLAFAIETIEGENVTNTTITPRGGADKRLSVPLIKQTTGTYCGPACVQMILKYFGIEKLQSQLATQMNTNSSGTFVYKITECLNSYLGSGEYKHILTSDLTFSTGLMRSIDAGKPVVCHTRTRYLPHYNGHDSNHYILATGYMWAQGGNAGGTDLVYYNDPNNNLSYYGSYSCRWYEMETAINDRASFYIMTN